MDRFFSKVKKTSGCWEWTAGKFSDGYGAFVIDGKTLKAHRVSWELANNEKIPGNLFVCHSCDNKSCVNPDHLFLGTANDNMQDKVKKNRQARGSQITKNRRTACGEKNGQSKLNRKKVEEIRKAYKSGEISQRQLAKRYKVSHILIGKVVRRELWK